MQGAIVLLAIVGLIVGSVTAHARLLNQCLGISMTLGVILVLVPGLNVIGLLLVVMSAVLAIMGECRKCKA